MKKMKRILALLLAVLMMASLSVTAFAEEEKGSITINGVGTGTTYEVYRLLDLESYNITSGAYSYKANAAWTGFFATEEAKKYLVSDDAGYFTWVAAEDDDTKAAFAKLALAYAKANSIAPTQSSTNDNEFVVNGAIGIFSNLSLGYYLVDSTMGALCGLTTTNPNASINAKNGIPTIDKQVQEDSTGQYGAENSADIGQIIEYRVTINVHAGAENYILHDTMGEGLKFEQESSENKLYPEAAEGTIEAEIFRGVWKIEHVVPGSNTHVVDESLYKVKTGDSVTADGCDFEIHFSEEFCNELETNDKIIISYNAMLTRYATIAGDENNKNTAWLSFGEGGRSNEDTVKTYTYRMEIVKTDSQNTLLNGAEFRIYDAATGGNEITVVLMDNGTSYRRARADEDGVNIVVADGRMVVNGLDNGTYYLEEKVAPNGYNKLTARQRFIISDGNLDATFNDGIYSTGSGVHVVNKTGSMLPETGGMGTVMFITFGMIVAMGTGVLLVTKKRMSMIQD